MNKHVVQAAEELCRRLRKDPTRSETIFWSAVRNRKFLGKKFLRQHPLFLRFMDKDTFFIADFYCGGHHLVVEVDGKSHDYQKEYDALRTHIINTLRINVVRFRNDEIESDLPNVLKALEEIMKN